MARCLFINPAGFELKNISYPLTETEEDYR
jgi:hypothetical protein